MHDKSKLPAVIHFIYSLGRGGAETIVVRTIKELPEYRHIVVTLLPDNHFGNELECDRLICLNMTGLFQLPAMFRRFGSIVKEISPALVHTHLFWPTFIARFAVPATVPLVTTIHAFIASSVEYRHWYIRFLDRFSYKRRSSFIIVVARGALEEYFDFLGRPPVKARVLYTFVDVLKFKGRPFKPHNGELRLISVGALRIQKNYPYIIKAMALLKDLPISLDIYGSGSLKESLQKQIDESGANVRLMGEVRNFEECLIEYDLYVMSSTFEGFSLSVLEAMAMEMPLLLSDISSFREQCGDLAWYFSLDDPASAADRLQAIMKDNREVLVERGKLGRAHVMAHFTLQQHIHQLRNIYIEVTARAARPT